MTHPNDIIPYGFCHCGCGEKTNVAPYSSKEFGWVGGQPMKFIRNHHHKLIRCSFPRPSIVIDRDPKLPWVRIRLTRGKTALIDRADLELVAVRSWQAHLFNRVWYAQNPSAGGGLARFIMGFPKDLVVDHKNGNPLDNRRANLRICTRAENTRNARRPKTNTSGFKGVSFRRGWYWSVVRGAHSGPFESATEAAKDYDERARQLYGEFARTNFKR